VEVTITLAAQEAADLIALLEDARALARGSDLEGFYFDLESAIREGLEGEGVTVQPRSPAHGPVAGGTLFAPAPRTMFAPGAEGLGRVPDVRPIDDPEAKPQKFEFREAAGMEPRQGLKPVFK
jgi:hypothetical protein